MELITLKQLLDHAAENSYGLQAFNINNMENIDGGLVGRSSIDPQSFIKLCHVADQLNCGEKV